MALVAPQQVHLPTCAARRRRGRPGVAVGPVARAAAGGAPDVDAEGDEAEPTPGPARPQWPLTALETAYLTWLGAATVHYTATHTRLREPLAKGQQLLSQRLELRLRGADAGREGRPGLAPGTRAAPPQQRQGESPASRARVEADRQLVAAQRRLARAQAEVARIGELQRQHQLLTAQRVAEAAQREELVEEQRQRVAEAESGRLAAAERARLEAVARSLEAKASRAEAKAKAEQAQRLALEERVAAARSQSLEAQSKATAESQAQAVTQAKAAVKARVVADQLVATAAQSKQAAATAAAAAAAGPVSAPARRAAMGSRTSSPSTPAPASATAPRAALGSRFRSPGTPAPLPPVPAPWSSRASDTFVSLAPVIEAIPRVAPFALGVPLAAAALAVAGREGMAAWGRHQQAQAQAAEQRAQVEAEEAEARRVRLREMVFGPGAGATPRAAVSSRGRAAAAGDSSGGDGSRRLVAPSPQAAASEWIAAWRWRRAADRAGVAVQLPGADDSSDGFWDSEDTDAADGDAADEWADPEAVKQQVKQLQRFMRDIRGS